MDLTQLKRYRSFLIALVATGFMYIIQRELAFKATVISVKSFIEMLLVIPPIFVILGLLDVWVPKETMVKFMGEQSGLKGIILAFLIGSAAAGPLYGAFPVAAIFMKKGVSFKNILIFIGAWSTTKIPMFLFETSSLGLAFSLTRLLVNIPGILIISFLISKAVSKKELTQIYANASK